MVGYKYLGIFVTSGVGIRVSREGFRLPDGMKQTVAELMYDRFLALLCHFLKNFVLSSY